MTPETLAVLLQQHSDMLAQLEKLWTAFLLLLFLGLLFILCVMAGSVWTVRRITTNQDNLEKKWTELLDLLIHNARDHA